MNIAAYWRYSTDKEYHLNSLETQKQFFLEYTKCTGDSITKFDKKMNAAKMSTVIFTRNVGNIYYLCKNIL